jgi:hypothetical protein
VASLATIRLTVAIGGPCGNAEELGLHIVVSRENEHCRLLDSLGYVARSGTEVWVLIRQILSASLQERASTLHKPVHQLE